MTKNDKYDLLEGWLFWYDAEEDLWKAAAMEDFVNSIKKRQNVHVVAASTLNDLFVFITTGLDDIN